MNGTLGHRWDVDRVTAGRYHPGRPAVNHAPGSPTVPLPYDHPALAGTGARGAWLALRALHAISSGTGWVRYVANADRMAGAHVLDIRQRGDKVPHHRIIYRSEVWWWALGFADGWGHGDVLDALVGERPPQLVPVGGELAARLGLSLDGLHYRMKRDRLYTVYVVDEQDHRVRRFVPAAQVAVEERERPTPAALRRWDHVRSLIPDQPRPEQISERITPRPSPDPLPIDRSWRTPVRQREALALARELGWIAEFVNEAGTFAVTLPPGGIVASRRLPAKAVEPYLLGLGDGRGGLGRLVAYRDELG